MTKGKLENISFKTNGVKIDGAWYNASESIIQEVRLLERDSVVEYSVAEENVKKLHSIKGFVNHEKASVQTEVKKFINADEQIRESALKSACSSLSSTGEYTVSFIIMRAVAFEKYIKAGSSAVGQSFKDCESELELINHGKY